MIGYNKKKYFLLKFMLFRIELHIHVNVLNINH